MNIKANNYGFILPDGCQLAIVRGNEIVDSGHHIASQAFNAAGQVYLDAMDKYIDQNQIKHIAEIA